jgi:hypothetical protein
MPWITNRLLSINKNMRPQSRIVPPLWSTVIFLAMVGIDAVMRRTVVLLLPGSFSSPNNPAAVLDRNFARRGAWTTGHILPGLLFMVLGPLPFASWIRLRRLSVSWLATAGCNHQPQRELHSD